VLIVDTGPLVATADRADKDHEACRQLLESDEGPLVTTAMVTVSDDPSFTKGLPAHSPVQHVSITASVSALAGRPG
jgi:hypothetical protein